MLVDEGALRIEDGVCRSQGDLDALALPASLHALLGARLDRLDARRPRRRSSAARSRASSSTAAPSSSSLHRVAPLGARRVLDALADKDLVRAAEASFADESAFRFKHVLVRDSRLPGDREEAPRRLHEQFADWLERVAGDRVTEYEEILGHHLEQSYRYRAELGPVDEETRALGERAAVGSPPPGSAPMPAATSGPRPTSSAARPLSSRSRAASGSKSCSRLSSLLQRS